MKAVIQRVKNASVMVVDEEDQARRPAGAPSGRVSGRIDAGLLVYLGVAQGDTEEDARCLAEKITFLRIFEDEEGKKNRSVLDSGGGVLVVSQFTLLADARKGRRPYYGNAADSETAKALYEYFIERIRKAGLLCESGVFQAHMEVASVNYGPITILLDSKELKRIS
ncbi:MAG: D-tyrosyl-tRNA(Tyr) deacylase [Spirochaetaceae bacterium]|jgi:D-tyrosyl-tRNA(Tyr) deacylase|nr:D-tyrosyl-tRNA(Tyr) deacylase [Spirochaetaceae bacterium]